MARLPRACEGHAVIARAWLLWLGIATVVAIANRNIGTAAWCAGTAGAVIVVTMWPRRRPVELEDDE